MDIQLILTEDCNLSCAYCYMKNKVKNYMTKEDIDLLLQNIDFLLKEYKTSRCKISYFGGEPLLNWEVLKYAYNRFSQDNRVLEHSLTSNLLLIDEEKVEFLNKSKIRVSWSFDGLWQNENRPLKNFQQSHNIYLQKQDLLKKLKIYRIITVVQPNNISQMVENLEYLATWNLSPTYQIALGTIWTDQDIDLFDKEFSRVCDRCVELTKQGSSILAHSLFLIILRVMKETEKNNYNMFSCNAGINLAAFFPNGIIYPCAMFGNNKKLPLYNIRDKISFQQNIDFIKNMAKHNLDTHKQCSNCNIFPYCFGGCSYLNLYNQKDNTFGNPPIFCKIFKIIIRESMRLYEELKHNDLFYQLLQKK